MLDFQSTLEQLNLEEKALSFLDQYFFENELEEFKKERIAQVIREIKEIGKYKLSSDELAYGSKLAWRNSNRCIGRLFWKTLKVFDYREINNAEIIFLKLQEHIQYATNQGNIRSCISIFPCCKDNSQGIRIWNSQLIRYAGHILRDGKILGDPLNVELTQQCLKMGWSKKEKTAFDILPVIIQMPGQQPQLFELDKNIVLEVPIEHPEYSFFKEMNLKWHALPIITNMKLEIGGTQFTCAPFSGFYMGTEIGARNLGDERRYNLLPVIAEKMKLDTGRLSSLWKDKALVELNVAVLYSFTKKQVKIIDHHTSAQQFIEFEKAENKINRKVTAEWEWIVPPISASATPVFHKTYENKICSPKFDYQEDAWKY